MAICSCASERGIYVCAGFVHELLWLLMRQGPARHIVLYPLRLRTHRIDKKTSPDCNVKFRDPPAAPRIFQQGNLTATSEGIIPKECLYEILPDQPVQNLGGEPRHQAGRKPQEAQPVFARSISLNVNRNSNVETVHSGNPERLKCSARAQGASVF